MSISETITQLQASFVANQGQYDLTADALAIRNQRPLHAGDAYIFTFTYVQSDGTTPIDLTGQTITFTAKYRVSDTDPSAIVQKTATIVGVPTDGVFTFKIDTGDVAGPQAQHGIYDIQMNDGTDIETILHGDIEFKAQITAT